MAATHKFSEDSIKLALLIASTFDSKGLLNDARLMEAVFIYFSGHGGLVKPPPDRDTLRDENGLEIRREYKFLVHYDVLAYDIAGVLLSGGKTEVKDVVDSVEILAQGHHLLTLEQGNGSEALEAPVEISFGLYPGKNLPTDGSAVVSQGDKIYFTIRNRLEDDKIYVSVFNISHTGEISLISSRGETGIPIAAGRTVTDPVFRKEARSDDQLASFCSKARKAL
ncbi:hypothetical protein BKA81DRAFT_408660 [Phyllosticta paracitricarpa]